MWKGYGYDFATETTGHNKTVPGWADVECPLCGKEWLLSQELAIKPPAGPIYHADCYNKRKAIRKQQSTQRKHK